MSYDDNFSPLTDIFTCSSNILLKVKILGIQKTKKIIVHFQDTFLEVGEDNVDNVIVFFQTSILR